MKRARWIALVVIVVVVGLQFVPVARTNPQVEMEVDAPPEVLAILRRACYDCHSYETSWPWYSRVAPMSFLVAHDVEEGREHLNFSTWNRLRPAGQAEAIHEVWEEVEEGEMPLWFYTPLHPEARLSEADLKTLEAWADSVAPH